jgi:transposase
LGTRRLLVETLGLLLTVVVHPADVRDRDGAVQLLESVPTRSPRLAHLWLDARYAGKTVTWIEQTLGLRVTVVRKLRRRVRCPANQDPPPTPAGFPVLPRRWVVERTFAWVGQSRC